MQGASWGFLSGWFRISLIKRHVVFIFDDQGDNLIALVAGAIRLFVWFGVGFFFCCCRSTNIVFLLYWFVISSSPNVWARHNFAIYLLLVLFFWHSRKLPSCLNWYTRLRSSSGYNCKWKRRRKRRNKIASHGYLFVYLFLLLVCLLCRTSFFCCCCCCCRLLLPTQQQYFDGCCCTTLKRYIVFWAELAQAISLTRASKIVIMRTHEYQR